MSAPAAKVQVPLSQPRETKDIGAGQVMPRDPMSQLSSQVQPWAAPFAPFVDPASTMMTPFTSLFDTLGSMDTHASPNVINIFNREFNHLNRLARRAANIQPSLVVDVMGEFCVIALGGVYLINSHLARSPSHPPPPPSSLLPPQRRPMSLKSTHSSVRQRSALRSSTTRTISISRQPAAIPRK